MVEDSEIEKIILNQTEELPQKGERLLREANQNGGKDNIAVILVEPFTNEVEKC
jgi:protein phosphatase